MAGTASLVSSALVCKTESSMRKYLYIAGLTQTLLLLPQSAYAQDATVLVVLLAPPILLAPVCVAFARWFWLRRGFHTPARFMLLFLVSCFEVFLWVVISVSAVVVMSGDWGIQAILSLVVTCGATWMLSGIWFEGLNRAARWVFFVSPPLALVLLAVTTWLVLIASGW